MKASFKSITYYPTLDCKTPATDNFTQAVAEAVYQAASNFAEHKLAHRIAESEGDIELTAQEVNTVKRAISGWKFFVQMPILSLLGESFDE